MIYSQFLSKEKNFPVLIDALKKEKEPVLVKGICENLKLLFISEVIKTSKRRTLIVLPDETTAKEYAERLSAGMEKVFFFPSREYEIINFDSTARDFTHLRNETVSRVISDDFDAVVTSAEALMQLTMQKSSVISASFDIKIGDSAEMGILAKKLIDSGYKRFDKVEGKGQFAQRGDILDVFVPSMSNPVRIEFFGDSVDAMGVFDVISQRRIENVFELKITPADEIFFSTEELGIFEESLEELIKAEKDPERREFLKDTSERIKTGRSFGKDMFLPLSQKRETFLDYFGKDTLFVIENEKALQEELDASNTILEETLKGLCEKKKIVFPNENLVLSGTFGDFAERLNSGSTLILDNFSSGKSAISPKGIYAFNTRDTSSSFSNINILNEDIISSCDLGFYTFIAAPNAIVSDNLLNHFTELGKKCTVISQESEIEFKSGEVYIVRPEKNSVIPKGGFELGDSKFILFSDSFYLAKKRNRRKVDSKIGRKITSFADLVPGDYVVHINHGIGIFEGVEKLPNADGFIKDFIKIRYQGSDVLYVPTSNLDSVSKYIGPKSDSANLKLNKMGGAEWKKTTARAKESANKIASRLIALYSERLKQKGFGFSKDTPWQEEFEEKFPYGETEGQLTAAKEIKSDMEKSIPMDRLLCGDVGFGKTEVALRGVFKCIMDNKQAAILVPTTILAWQHYQTILSRFKGYPVKVEMLSRFRTKKEQSKILEKLKKGEIDIIVGTHRLLQKDVVFSGLGFLVIDEEQRFGVTHKERLKEMSRGVDCLTLTATPIPRTLNMALGGIRDMSVLEEAPEDRFPVQTFVLEYDISLITEAIRKELKRRGQVFYLLNNIEELNSRAGVISRIFPDAEIAVAHGALDKDSLSDIWRDMTEKKIDILFCTTIIETGIDLPDANTLIIENADRFGLSQLHQLRGRVGRSDRKAYAYLTYKKGKMLSEISQKRLNAIREYTEFGSGFKIALRDLELRGAGNLLGSEQHGHLDSVGYDLFMQILSDAVREEKGEKPKEREECTVDLPISAYLPEKYVPSETDRLEIYRKIADIQTDADIIEIKDEISDRFGEIPQVVENLFKIVKIKRLAELSGCTKVFYSAKKLYFNFNNANQDAILMLIPVYASRIFVSLTGKVRTELTCTENHSIIDESEELLIHLSEFSKSEK